MRWLAAACALCIGTAVLGALYETNPGYNRAFRPFVTDVPPDQAGDTRLFGGKVTGWKTTDRMAFSHFGSDRLIDTQGVFLLVDLRLHATTETVGVRASWRGASGRIYAATKRTQSLPRQINGVLLQPGLDMSALAVFELPRDEIDGGALILTMPIDPAMEGTLRLAPPTTAPAHTPEARFGA